MHSRLTFYADGRFAYTLVDNGMKEKAMQDGEKAVNTCLLVLLRKHPEVAEQFEAP